MYYNLICTPMWTKFYSCKKWVLQQMRRKEQSASVYVGSEFMLMFCMQFHKHAELLM
jgi:hypothetical protein